jgi:hypothetical protein
MKNDDKVLIQTRVPGWVRDSLLREAEKEQRTVSNLLAKWLTESCERHPDYRPSKLPVGAAPPGPQPRIDPRERHQVRPIEEGVGRGLESGSRAGHQSSGISFRALPRE